MMILYCPFCRGDCVVQRAIVRPSYVFDCLECKGRFRVIRFGIEMAKNIFIKEETKNGKENEEDFGARFSEEC